MVASGINVIKCAYILSLFSMLWPHVGQASPILPPEDNQRRRDILDPSLLEQTDNVDIQQFLGKFLSVLNFTHHDTSSWVPSPPQPPAPRVEPPEYMLELYNHFANDHSVRPTGNTVRSFKNQDNSATTLFNRHVMIHPLLFNISIPHHENVINAELRLYMLLPQNHYCLPVEHRVTIFEVREPPGQWSNGGQTDMGQQNILATRQQVISSHAIGEKENGWEVFELTDAVQNWKESDLATHYLEVHTESLGSQGQVSKLACNSNSGDPHMLDIDRDVFGKRNPVLIVFSDDQSRDQQDEKQELDEMIEREFDLLGGNELWANGGATTDDVEDTEALMQIHSNMIYGAATRVRRNTADKYCMKTPLYVEFKDIGWDSWVVAPEGYHANACRGLCQVPLTPDVSPTKHATIQSLVNFKFPKRASPPCCVPTKLDPISLLYKDQKGVITLKHRYEDMVVAECGCR